MAAFDKVTAVRFFRAVRNLANSEVGSRAKVMFAALFALLLAINGMNVLNSYVGRDFMTAIANRNKAEFVRQALLYIGVFAGSTIFSVVLRFAEERLGVLWREFVTRRAIELYLAEGNYYRLETTEELQNPDQRIAEDLRAFTVTTMSFVLMVLNSSFTILAFSGVLWSISPMLFGLAVLYAACGSYVTIVLGRPLINLNYDQLDKEANFRSALIHVRQNAESVLLAGRESGLRARLLKRLDDLVTNFRKMTSINRNVSFFTTGYNWMIQIIPALIVAPAFINREIEFGVIGQSAMAFATLVAAFSLIITQYQSISNFSAVLARLNSLFDALERKLPAADAGIDLSEDDERVAYEQLNLLSAQDGHSLLENLSISIPFGSRVLISGSNEAAKVALFRATAGVSTSGKGRIIRPGTEDLLFLAERPYLPPGSLRDVLLRKRREHSVTDEQIKSVLHELDLDPVLDRAGGLNVERDWGALLSLGEQQILAFIHVLLAAPRFVFLDRAGTALDSGLVRKILKMLSENAIGFMNIGEIDDAENLYNAILEIHDRGDWTWRKIGIDVGGAEV
jgi:putative ATP-binding cassette transporter